MQRLVLPVMSLFVAACSSMPTGTQTGTVQEIIIGEQLAPAEVTAHPGDEIRWINRSGGLVQILFLDSIEDRIACQRGFGFSAVAARLPPNASASLCFLDPGVVRYTVRIEPLPSGSGINLRGIIHVTPSLRSGAGS